MALLRRLLIFVPGLMFACYAPLDAQPTLQITSPVNGAVFSPGQTIQVSVSSSGGLSPVFVVGQNIGFSTALSAPPYNFSLQIPTNIDPNQYTIRAVGMITPGNLVKSPRITIVVQRPDSPVSLRVEPSVLKLNIGANGYLRVVGTYGDGSTADLTQAPSTSYVSNSPAIATVNNWGMVTAVSSGSTTIVVNGTEQVPVTVAPAMRIAPVQKALYAGQSQKFYPRLADSSVANVTWSLNPPGVGSISSSGVYTAPSPITAAQSSTLVLVTATYTQNNTISATATVTLLQPVSIGIAPSIVMLLPSQSAQFSAPLSNAVNLRVNWSLAPNVWQISIFGQGGWEDGGGRHGDSSAGGDCQRDCSGFRHGLQWSV